MSQDYVLNQKCPACGTRKQSTLSEIKAQRVFECNCCGLVMAVRGHEQVEPRKQPEKQGEALAV